jgi:uncharacterized protein (TIGR03435 family)
MRSSLFTVLIALCPCAALGQASDSGPQFEIADVHVSAKTQLPFPRTSPVRGGRYEVKTATLLDLIRIAYGYDTDKILGGPNWLEMNRYDVIAKVPADSTPDTQKLMLQSLLADRFKLVLHKDSRPFPTYALKVGKKLQLKEADGKGDTGCTPQSSAGPAPEGGMRIMMAGRGGSGAPVTISLGPGMLIQYNCRNMSMKAFAEGLRYMMGANATFGGNPVLDETGLEGRWNFDVKWSMQMIGGPMMGGADERIAVTDAIEKQLGLKLEKREAPTPVLVVDSAIEKPTPNSPEVAAALPPIPAPTEFEVADIKPSEPGGRGGRFQMQPGGRLVTQNSAMTMLLMQAFATRGMDELVGIPSWAQSAHFDITAKAPSSGPMPPAMDMESVAPMLRSMLVERFGLKYHTEEKPQTAYTLVAAKPKMKKADPSSRTWCRNIQAPPGSPQGAQSLQCQNITMAQFADRLQHMSMELGWPVTDSTGIEGGWDFTLTYTQSFPGMMMAAGRGGDGGPGAPGVGEASDPAGGADDFSGGGEATGTQTGGSETVSACNRHRSSGRETDR